MMRRPLCYTRSSQHIIPVESGWYSLLDPCELSGSASANNLTGGAII